ncbi:MAG: hypothetical protein R2736_15095 [Solirubrobacterales bacterium]
MLGDGDTIARARLATAAWRRRRCARTPPSVPSPAPPPRSAAYAEAARLAEDVVEAPDDIAASQAFRRHLVNRLTQRALRTAGQRARERSER